MQTGIAIIAFSHLRWDFVYQRPQHLLSRLAQRHRILFIEEPVVSQSRNRNGNLRSLVPTSRYVVPPLPVPETGFHEQQLPILKLLFRELVEREKLSRTCSGFTRRWRCRPPRN